MAARHQNDNATMLSIESLYQQSEVVRTLKVSQPDTIRTAMKRRKRFRLPLITSKPLDSFLSDNGASAASDGLDGLVLSGLKYPAVEQDTTLPKSLNLGHVKSAIAQHSQQTTRQNSLQGRNTDTLADTDLQTASDDNADPMQAIRQAVMTAAEEHSQPAAGETRRSEKSALQQDLQALIAKLVTVIEEEVEDRLIRQNVSQQPAPARQAAKRPAKRPATSASPVAKKAKSKAKVKSSSAKTGKAPSRTGAKKDRR